MKVLMLFFIALFFIAGCTDAKKSEQDLPSSPAHNPDIYEEVDGYSAAEIKKKELRNAYNNRKWEKVLTLVKECADVNIEVKGHLGYPVPMLLQVIKSGQKSLARDIIAAPGCDVNIKSTDGTSALELATSMEYHDLADLLLKKGAHPLGARKEPLIKDIQQLESIIGTVSVKNDPDYSIVYSTTFSAFKKLKKEEKYAIVKKMEQARIAGGNIAPSVFSLNWFKPEDAVTKSEDAIIIVLNDQGFASIMFILTVWDRLADGRLKMRTILDRAVCEGIGTVYTKALHSINDKEAFIVGESFGADGGDTWGSWWIGLWTKPRRFRILKRIKYYLPPKELESGQSRKVHFTYDLEIENKTAVVKEQYKLIKQEWGNIKKQQEELLKETVHTLNLERLIQASRNDNPCGFEDRNH
jgi:hypothetical protein